MSRKTKAAPEPKLEAVRNIRLHLPDPLYRSLRHRLVEAGPQANISKVIVELLEVALDLTGDRT